MKSTPTQTTEMPHIGNMIKSHFKTNRIHQATLGRAMSVSPHTIVGYKKAPTLQLKTIWNLCHSLQHNFLMDIALQLPENYSINQHINKSKYQQIADLERRIEVLEIEKAILLQVKG